MHAHWFGTLSYWQITVKIDCQNMKKSFVNDAGNETHESESEDINKMLFSAIVQSN